MADVHCTRHACSHERELLRAWLLSHADIHCERVDGLLDRLDAEEVDCIDDLELLDLECCLKQVTARKIRRALARRASKYSEERTPPPLPPSQRGPAFWLSEVSEVAELAEAGAGAAVAVEAAVAAEEAEAAEAADEHADETPPAAP